MHKIETILFGIALILFGIASMLITGSTNWGLFAILGFISPILGLITAIIGLFDKGYSKDEEEEE